MPTFEMDGQTSELILDQSPAAEVPQSASPEPTIRKRAPKPPAPRPGPKTRSQRRTERPRTAKPEPEPATPEVTVKRSEKAKETLDLSATICLMFGKAYSSASLRADGHTIAAASQPLADAVANVAAHDKAVARMLDNDSTGRISAYVALASVSISLGAQLAANHGFIKPGMMGTASKEDVLATFETPDDATDNAPS